MTAEPLLHPHSKRQLEQVASRQLHAILLTGPTGTGKLYVARWLAAKLLDTPSVDTHPYVITVNRGKEKSIGIEAVRDLERALSLKVPNSAAINRVVIIEDAHVLTGEAQNALLKTLEEPPTGTTIILTAASEQALLPTIRSRVASVPVKAPPTDVLRAHFSQTGQPGSKLDQALAISGGLPGLIAALLGDAEHQLLPAIDAARQLLQKTSYERLASIDLLAKDRELTDGVLFILQQMAEVQLRRGAQPERWSKILQAAYEAEQGLAQSGQAKLVLSNLMLNLG
jgi:replication-associated recombination protein RarA